MALTDTAEFRAAGPRRRSGRLARLGGSVARRLMPGERMRVTYEGWVYLGVWVGLVVIGLNQQSNLVLLTAGLAAGPIAASLLVSGSMLKRVKVERRQPAYAFAGEPLAIDYSLANLRKKTASIGLRLVDDFSPVVRGVPDASRLLPSVTFARVGGGQRVRARWQSTAPGRGLYRFGSMELVTRAPFGLVERRSTLSAPGEMVVYPRVGQLARRWHQIHREVTESRRGQRHDRSAQQQEYHGLRDYRPGDSPRWIHWRTTARLGVPMVKEFEQQSDQDLAILLDPWQPRTKVTPEHREALEALVRFAATVCLETCRGGGRRLLLGWTGPQPGVRQGPSSVKLSHELLGRLAVLRPSAEGTLSALFDASPPAMLREAFLVVVSTRPVNLVEEAERSGRLNGPAARGLAGRVLLLDSSRGDLDALVRYDLSNPSGGRTP